ncbi:MAG: dTDP-4-dehydrorhamnose reductase [Clostridia bacterium]|nr:dTDP-4-dehydrorhamnose reductase [Clostridia bacterium]
MSIFVTGVGGQLGHDVIEELYSRGLDYIAPSHDELDLCDRGAVLEFFNSNDIDAVMHCAAYTAVDKAESEPDLCMSINADATAFIAECCASRDIPLMYISTDYVFPGTGDMPYSVDDPKGPLQVYGKSKLAGESAVLAACSKCFIVRVSWVFGSNGGNFVKTILRLASERDCISVVADQVGSPTYTRDLAVLLCDMITTASYGIYHATNEGFCSFYDFACEIVRLSGSTLDVVSITSDQYAAAATRPLNSRLSKSSLDVAGFNRLPTWQDALSRYLKEINQNAMDRT